MTKLNLAVVIITTVLNFFTLTYSWSGYIHHYEIEYINHSLVNVSAYVRKINRTTYAGNIFFELTEDIPLDSEVEIRIFGEYTNKYKELPLNLRRKICNMLDMEYQMIKNEIMGQFPDKCPIKKGNYFMKDYVLNMKYIPKNPWSDLKNFKLSIKCFNGRLKTITIILIVFIRTTMDDEYRK